MWVKLSDVQPADLGRRSSAQHDEQPERHPAQSWRSALKAAARAGLVLQPGRRLIAGRHIASGEVIFEFLHLIWRPAPDAFTTPYPGGRQFFDPLLAQVTCSPCPNGRVSTRLMALVARHEIQVGEIITREAVSGEEAH